MFTGIVEAVGTLALVDPVEGGYRVAIDTALAAELRLGDSLGVNGVCLTAVAIAGTLVSADVGPETARVTTLGSLRRGQLVNLERPMRINGRLDGHFVLGHVDGVGRVEGIRPDAGSYWLSVGFPDALAPLLIARGSVAVDGISLTVAALGEASFDVQVIPYTWSHTMLHTLAVGDHVNLECDMIGKYVVRAMQARQRPLDGSDGAR